MSWATLVTGYVAFKKGVSEELKKKIIKELEEELETHLEYDELNERYDIGDVNWHSHVTESRIEAVYQKWKPFFSAFSISLYYLNEADYDEYMEDVGKEDADSILTNLIDEIVDDIRLNRMYSTGPGYIAKLQALVEFLKVAHIDKRLVTRKMTELTEALQEGNVQESRDVLLNLTIVLEERYFTPAKLKKLVLVATA